LEDLVCVFPNPWKNLDPFFFEQTNFGEYAIQKKTTLTQWVDAFNYVYEQRFDDPSLT